MKTLTVSLAAAMTAAVNANPASAGNLLWDFQGIENVECVVPMNDLDGDGLPEAAIMHYDAGASGQDFLTVIRGSSRVNADVLWEARPWGGVSGGGGYGDRCLDTISDLDDDGHDDLVLGTAWGSRSAFHISSADGSVLALHDSYDDDESGWCYQVAPIGDVNGDGLPETAAAFGNNNRSVYLIDGASRADAREIWQFQLAWDGFTGVIGPGDLNGDRIPDVVAASGGNGEDNRVVALSGAPMLNSSPQILWSFEANGIVHDITSVPDVDGDDIPEIVSGTWYSDELVRLHSGATGEVIWSHRVGNTVMQVVDGGDMDGDGAHEIIVASWDNAARLVDGATGALLWRAPMGDDVWRVAAAGDLDGDGVGDVLAGSFDKRVAAFSGADGVLIWDHLTTAKIFSVRATQDVTGDGIDDVICGTQMLSGIGGKAYAIEGDSQGPWIDVEVENLTPNVAPGGEIRLRITATNGTRSRRPFDCWIGPEVLGTDIDVLAPGETRSTIVTGMIPADAPIGRRILAVDVGWMDRGRWDRAKFRVEIGGRTVEAGNPETRMGTWNLDEVATDPVKATTAAMDEARADRSRALVAAGLAAGLDADDILNARLNDSRR